MIEIENIDCFNAMDRISDKSTGIAARELNRFFLGYPYYFSIAKNRIFEYNLISK